MRTLPFIKMHGLGNDFVILDGRAAPIALDPAQLRWIGDRHRGVGFDQLALLERRDGVDAGVRFFNSDGTAAGACGNATRCVAHLIGRELGKRQVVLESGAGRLPATLLEDGRVRVEMTTPRLGWRDVPVAAACDTLELPVDHEGLPRPVGVSMGNPHVVFFVDDVDLAPRLGPGLERHPFFPDRANIGFAQVLGPERMRLRVFERGAGLTLACGSGACAALVAAVRRGLVERRAVLTLDGGDIEIEWSGEGPVIMTGPVATSFRGEIDMADMAVGAATA